MEAAPDSHPFRSATRPIVVFPFRTPEFEERFGIRLTRYWEDGLGHAMGRVVRLKSGRYFMLKELLDARTSRLFAEADDPDHTEEGLGDLLAEMNLKEVDCVWTMNAPDTILNLGSDS